MDCKLQNTNLVGNEDDGTHPGKAFWKENGAVRGESHSYE